MTLDAKCIYNRSITNQEMEDKMITEIPLEARSVNGLMEVAHAIDEAAPHVLAAAVTAQKH